MTPFNMQVYLGLTLWRNIYFLTGIVIVFSTNTETDYRVDYFIFNPSPDEARLFQQKNTDTDIFLIASRNLLLLVLIRRRLII